MPKIPTPKEMQLHLKKKRIKELTNYAMDAITGGHNYLFYPEDKELAEGIAAKFNKKGWNMTIEEHFKWSGPKQYLFRINNPKT